MLATDLNGALVDHQLLTLINEGAIRGFPKNGVQPTSLDLSVLNNVWHVAGSPSMGEKDGFSFQSFIQRFSFNSHNLLHGTVTLVPNNIYIAELQGDFYLPERIHGYANPKSSSGRIDIHCTLIAEGSHSYNTVPPGYRGRLYVIIVPQSFPITLTQGISLLQLRLFTGKRRFLTNTEYEEEHKKHKIIKNGELELRKQSALLHLNLTGSPANLIAQRMLKPIQLDKREQEPRGYFYEKPLYDNVLFLEPDQFLLATTIERVRIPPHMTAEMVPYDEEYGELRTHYAGFFDPGFGFGISGEVPDSGVVCEIRNMSKAPIILEHGQAICLLRYEYTAGKPTKTYGHHGLNIGSFYQQQTGIKLAKFFAPWQNENTIEETTPPHDSLS